MFFHSPHPPFLESAQELISDSAEVVRIGSRSAGSFIHAQPVYATLLGIGAGMLLGFVAGGRKPYLAKPSRKTRPGRRVRRS